MTPKTPPQSPRVMMPRWKKRIPVTAGVNWATLDFVVDFARERRKQLYAAGWRPCYVVDAENAATLRRDHVEGSIYAQESP